MGKNQPIWHLRLLDSSRPIFLLSQFLHCWCWLILSFQVFQMPQSFSRRTWVALVPSSLSPCACTSGPSPASPICFARFSFGAPPTIHPLLLCSFTKLNKTFCPEIASVATSSPSWPRGQESFSGRNMAVWSLSWVAAIRLASGPNNWAFSEY